MGTSIVKNVHAKPPIMTDAKHINNGPITNTIFSTNIVHPVTIKSNKFSAVNENLLPPLFQN
jgi:hypothetical protein